MTLTIVGQVCKLALPPQNCPVLKNGTLIALTNTDKGKRRVDDPDNRRSSLQT